MKIIRNTLSGLHPIKLLTYFTVICFAATSAADELSLSNGELLKGKLISANAQELEWNSEMLGVLKLPTKHVRSLNGKPLVINQLAIVQGGARPEYSGEISIDIEREKRGADKRELELNAMLDITTDRYRHSFVTDYERSERNGANRINEFDVEYEVQFFYRPDQQGLFLFAKSEWHQDHLSSFDDFWSNGVGSGFAWKPRRNFSLSAQLGFDKTYWETGFASQFDLAQFSVDVLYRMQDVPKSRVFLQLESTRSLSAPRILIYSAKAGVRYKMSDHLFAQISGEAEVFEFEFDTISIRDSEFEWKFNVGYQWGK